MNLSEINTINNRLISITEFNQGKASQLFRRAAGGEALVVLKNNHPIAYVLPCKEYELLKRLEKRCDELMDSKQSFLSDQILQTLITELRAFEKSGDNHDCDS